VTAFGGFFELELPSGRGSYHDGALPMASGRACLRHIVNHLRPRRTWIPFYVCDAVLAAIARAGASCEFYAIDEALGPVLPDDFAGDDALLYVNYFGINDATAERLAQLFGDRLIVDDTQAFFRRGHARQYSFNSVRKFFGVPDGGFAYGAGLRETPLRQPQGVHCDHLVNRLLGHQETAFEQFRQAEACVSDEPVGMSEVSLRLLANVDVESARVKRQHNFASLHALLGSQNRLPVSADVKSTGPFCYPLLLDNPVPWNTFWSRELFVPRLWPELEQRPDGRRFLWERQLADCLLPLPIDHRYGSADMERMAALTQEILGW